MRYNDVRLWVNAPKRSVLRLPSAEAMEPFVAGLKTAGLKADVQFISADELIVLPGGKIDVYWQETNGEFHWQMTLKTEIAARLFSLFSFRIGNDHLIFDFQIKGKGVVVKLSTARRGYLSNNPPNLPIVEIEEIFNSSLARKLAEKHSISPSFANNIAEAEQ